MARAGDRIDSLKCSEPAPPPPPPKKKKKKKKKKNHYIEKRAEKMACFSNSLNLFLNI